MPTNYEDFIENYRLQEGCISFEAEGELQAIIKNASSEQLKNLVWVIVECLIRTERTLLGPEQDLMYNTRARNLPLLLDRLNTLNKLIDADVLAEILNTIEIIGEDRTECNLLHIAVTGGGIRAVQWLLSAGARVDLVCDDYTPIDLINPYVTGHSNLCGVFIDETLPSYPVIQILLLDKGAKECSETELCSKLPKVRLGFLKAAFESTNSNTMKLQAEHEAAFLRHQEDVQTQGNNPSSDIWKFKLKEEDALVRSTFPVRARCQLTWEILRYRTRHLPRQLTFYPRISLNIGSHQIPAYDLRNADDYRFIVHTTRTDPKILSELAKGEADFLNSMPYLSCSYVDKGTRCFAGSHQVNILFALHMVLTVPASAIVYTAERDLGTPFACSDEDKRDYLNKLIRQCAKATLYQALLQQTREIPLSPFEVEQDLKSSKYYKECEYRNMGSLPLRSPDTLQRVNTSAHFNEMVVLGNHFNPHREKVVLSALMIEDHWLKDFMENAYQLRQGGLKIAEEYRKSQKEHMEGCLEQLAQSRIPILLVRTDIDRYQQRIPVRDRLISLIKKQQLLRCDLGKVLIKQQRLSHSTVENKHKQEIENRVIKFSKERNDLEQKYRALREEILGGGELRLNRLEKLAKLLHATFISQERVPSRLIMGYLFSASTALQQGMLDEVLDELNCRQMTV